MDKKTPPPNLRERLEEFIKEFGGKGGAIVIQKEDHEIYCVCHADTKRMIAGLEVVKLKLTTEMLNKANLTKPPLETEEKENKNG